MGFRHLLCAGPRAGQAYGPDWVKQRVYVRVCLTAVGTHHAAFTGLDSSGLPEGSTIYPESQDPGSKLGLEGEGRKKVPVKDERHWLVKNWIFLIPAGMLV